MIIKLLSRRFLIFILIAIFLAFVSYEVFKSAFKEFEDTVVDSSSYMIKDSNYKFKSLRSTKTNVRVGPSLDHNILWTYQKKGLPIEILEDIQGWSKIRDYQAKSGWIKNTLITTNRTGIISPWKITENNANFENLYKDTDRKEINIKLESGVLVNILSCDGVQCLLNINDKEGWIEQDLIFGVYIGEVIVLRE
jgi:SH3-like domain-containing protein